MELQDMKTLWEEMSLEIGKQKKLTDSLIIKMIKTDYRNKISKILIPEAIGSLVCFAQFLFILINFQKLNTWYLLVCGIVSELILLFLPIISIKAVRNIRAINISDNNYKQSLQEYSKGKIQFIFVQKISFYLGAILLVVALPVMGQLIGGKNLFIETKLWLWYPICAVFFYTLSKWVFKSYHKATSDAENILRELEG